MHSPLKASTNYILFNTYVNRFESNPALVINIVQYKKMILFSSTVKFSNKLKIYQTNDLLFSLSLSLFVSFNLCIIMIINILLTFRNWLCFYYFLTNLYIFFATIVDYPLNTFENLGNIKKQLKSILHAMNRTKTKP